MTIGIEGGTSLDVENLVATFTAQKASDSNP
jgi:hypothetical protein